MENIFNIQSRLLKVSTDDVFKSMGYRDLPDNEYIRQRVDTLLTEAQKTITVSFCFRIENGVPTTDSILIGGLQFITGPVIANLMGGANQFALFVATTGEDFDRWANPIKEQDSSMIDTFIIDSIGSCLVESAGDCMEEKLREKIDSLKHTNRFSPGYCGWDVKEQHKLFSTFTNTCGISLTDTALMRPIKSISGMIGIGEQVSTRKYGCALCELTTCYKRKTRK